MERTPHAYLPADTAIVTRRVYSPDDRLSYEDAEAEFPELTRRFLRYQFENGKIDALKRASNRNKDPEKKRLSDEAAKYRVRAKKLEESLTEATATIQDLRLHNSFMGSALPLVNDLDATWKLCDHSLAKIDDDGNVTGMDTMIAAALRSYPYLEHFGDTVPPPVSGSRGTP